MVRGLSIYRDDYLFHKCQGIFFIFSHVPSASENIQESFSHKWNKFDIQSLKHCIFHLLHFFWFLNMLCFLRHDCNTWPELTIADQFHIENIIHSVKITAYEDIYYLFYSIDILTRYVTAENVISVYNIQCLCWGKLESEQK